MKTIRVGVIMGGRGNEKEVSFNSGRTVCDHLDTFRYTIIPIFQRANGSLYILPDRFLHRGKISDFEHRLTTEAEKISWAALKERIDFMYIAMHGRLAEDGTLQGFLEVLRIPYLGSKVLASAIGMDKIFQKKAMHAAGVRVPRDVTIMPAALAEYKKHPEKLSALLEDSKLIAPYFVKPHKEGSSLGASAVFDQKDLLSALEKAATINSIPQAVVLEEFITGMEFSCIIITDYTTGNLIPLPPTEIIPEANTHFLDYEQKYMPGRATKFTPARCSSERITQIQNECMKVMRALGFENIARIDGFVTNAGIVITDPNTLCGMSPSTYVFRQAAELNMSHTELINHLIETELVHYGLLRIEESSRGAKLIGAHIDSGLSTVERRRSSVENKIKVGVLLGGRSHEKEISLESGRNVFYKLSPQKYEPIALFLDDNLELYRIDQALLVRNSTKEIVHGLTPNMKISWEALSGLINFAFIALHGGEGENGCIQGTLEMLGIPYNGSSVLTSAMCMDKYKTATFLKSQGFDVPNNYLVERESWERNQHHEISAIIGSLVHMRDHKPRESQGNQPQLSYHGAQDHASLWKQGSALIVKPHDDGCSVLVHKIKSTQELIKAIDIIFADGKEHALVEEYISGMELTVGVVGNHTAQALPPSQAVSTGDILSIEEKFLPGAGENQTPAPLPQATLSLVQKIMQDAYTTLNCKGYSRIDCFYQATQQSPTGHERVVILEVNTLPGLTPATCIFHQAAEIGLKPMEFIDLIVKLGLEEHGTHVMQDLDDKKSRIEIPATPPSKPVFITEETI